MPVIISFILVVGVGYYIIVTGDSGISALLPRFSFLQKFVMAKELISHGIAFIVSLAGFFIAGSSAIFVQGKTLVVGGKKTLILFAAIFILFIIILGIRVVPVFESFFLS